MSTKSNNQLAFIFDDLTEFYAARELIDALKRKKIPTDIIVPFDSGYNKLPKHTFDKIKTFGYSPLKDVPKNKTYKILLTPYPILGAIRRAKFIYHIRLPYSTISAKPDPVYNMNFKIDYDAILCFNNYEPTFLNGYGADCYAVPYWKYDNFKKASRKSQKPTLLILPTFGQDTSCVEHLNKSIIDQIKKSYRVIIKAHHATQFGQDGEKTLKKLQSLADQFYDSDTPITELLQKADLVLSDNSGSIFESIYSNTPVVTFSKDLNARHLDTIDTLQYQLMCRKILPHTSDPAKIPSLLSSAKSYFKKQQNLKSELFPKNTKNSVSITVSIITQYLNKDASKDYKKVLHDAMVKEWYKDKSDLLDFSNRCNYLDSKIKSLESEIKSLESAIKEKDAVFASGSYRLYNKIIKPYKLIKGIKGKKGKNE